MEALTANEIQRLNQDGYIALSGIVSPSQVAAMNRRLEQLLETTPQEHAGTLIVGNLLAESIFDAAWSHPRILNAVETVLGGSFRLLGVSSRGLRAGHGQQALHTDWGGQGESGTWYLCHAICALVDFTSHNGATRVLPGSHRNPWMRKSIRDPLRPHPEEIQLLGAAGTVFILNVHCLHSAVRNASEDPRLALFASFSRRDSPLLAYNPPTEAEACVLQRLEPRLIKVVSG